MTVIWTAFCLPWVFRDWPSWRSLPTQNTNATATKFLTEEIASKIESFHTHTHTSPLLWKFKVHFKFKWIKSSNWIIQKKIKKKVNERNSADSGAVFFSFVGGKWKTGWKESWEYQAYALLLYTSERGGDACGFNHQQNERENKRGWRTYKWKVGFKNLLVQSSLSLSILSSKSYFTSSKCCPGIWNEALQVR